MAKPAGSRCNLACKYCYYLEKSNLYADNPQEVMSDELLEVFIRDHAAGAVYLARRRNTDAPLELLQKSD